MGDEVDGRFLVVDYLFNTAFTYATREDIKRDVLSAKTLGWSWSIINSGVYHTAVVIYLDGQPRYSVNWGPKSQTYAFQLIRGVEGEITYGVETGDAEMTEYKDILGTVNIGELPDEKAVDEILEKLLHFDKSTYHIAACNCRDHVLRVMEGLMADAGELDKLKTEIESIRFKAEGFFKSFFESFENVEDYQNSC